MCWEKHDLSGRNNPEYILSEYGSSLNDVNLSSSADPCIFCQPGGAALACRTVPAFKEASLP